MVGQGNVTGDGNVIGQGNVYNNTDSNPHPICTKGSICLWPGKGFKGDVWMWTPGEDKDGPIPEHLQNRIGSFEAQATGCFVDSDTNEKRQIGLADWSGRYIEKFGMQADTLKARC